MVFYVKQRVSASSFETHRRKTERSACWVLRSLLWAATELEHHEALGLALNVTARVTDALLSVTSRRGCTKHQAATSGGRQVRIQD